MSLRSRVEAIEAALAKQRGEYPFQLIWREDGETEAQARERAGLADWPGEVICCGWIEENL